jgi:serine/threonine protein kinase
VTRTDELRRFRVARALASPLGVLITVPALVIAVGVGILLVGRAATSSASQSMARRQLSEQASAVQSQVAFALDQAAPILDRLNVLADPARPLDDTLVRLHDLIVGRPGVAYASLSFPDGQFRGAYRTDKGEVETQSSSIEAGGTTNIRYKVFGANIVEARRETTSYDPRQRSFYQLAEKTKARVWSEPYTFFNSWSTGITCAQPLYVDGKLVAVLTVDFDVGALSSYVGRPGLDQARSVVFTRDGILLAYPAADKLGKPSGDKLMRAEDMHDPALTALLAWFTKRAATTELAFVELSANDGSYLTSIAPIGGTRAGVTAPLDWYVATIVPTRTLLGPTQSLVRRSVIASAGALAIAVGLALVLAWNLVRMRRAVAKSKAEARSAEARAKELGSYRLVAKLGAGGMGEVWRAEHRLLARTAAIKLIRADALVDPAGVEEVRERFRREAQTLASMRSRHTTAIFDYGVADDGTFYYVMELLDGIDLEMLVHKDGAQSAARVIHLMLQACQSLAEAHDAGLLHRDIKPPNLFISRAADEVDIVKLLDFGIVMSKDEMAQASVLRPSAQSLMTETPKLTQMGAMLGTPGFMAPEQILGMKLDGRADLYSLGCVAWWLLTGNEVFLREGGDAALLRRHMYEEPPPLVEKTDQWFPAELEDVLRACLAKEADDRPRDARHLAGMLRHIRIPPEHTWSESRAQAWWSSLKPVVAPPVRESQVQMLMTVAPRK